MNKLPFTILTGWLGVGKTSTLNELLPVVRSQRIAVLVNELGRIAIDTQLIVHQGSDVLELAGGCVCCSLDLRNDLWDGIHDIVARSEPSQVILETTGIAEPAALLASLRRVEASTRERILPAGVVVVVDAARLSVDAARHSEVIAQLACADRVLLRKRDLASDVQLSAAHATIRKYAPSAEVAAFDDDEAGRIAMAAWVLDVRAVQAPPETPPHRHGQLEATAIVSKSIFVREPLLQILTAWGDRLVRAKGFVRLADGTAWHLLEKAGDQVTLRPLAPSHAVRQTTSDLVFIGEGLNEAEVMRALSACSLPVHGGQE